MNTSRCDRTPAWAALQAQFETTGRTLDVRDAFAADPQRFGVFSQSAPHIFADLSKNLIDEATQALLLDLARQSGLESHRDAMFAGDKINTTEQRAVMHWLLRTPAQAQRDGLQGLSVELAQVHATLDAMLAYAEAVRADEGITDVVNIGIGGSDLGPHMAVQALEAYRAQGKRLHFVSNIDGHELHAALQSLQPSRTLFL